MKKKIQIPKSIKSYGYVGVWNDPENTVGWFMPNHAGGERKYPEAVNPEAEKYIYDEEERFFLCEIIVKPIKDCLGRPITKIVRKKQGT